MSCACFGIVMNIHFHLQTFAEFEMGALIKIQAKKKYFVDSQKALFNGDHLQSEMKTNVFNNFLSLIAYQIESLV